MPTLELTVEQVASLVKTLPRDAKRDLLMAVASEGTQAREARIDRNERRLKLLATQQGLDWDAMDDDQRQSFVDGLLHAE